MAYGYYPQYYQPQMQYASQQLPQANNQQVPQNGGFLAVPNEEVVNSYPVAPGNCVTFKIEGKPIVMEKSMGFSQFESPKIDKYRLVKEEVTEAHRMPQKDDVDLQPIFDTTDGLKAEIEAIWKELEALKTNQPRKSTTSKKKEVVEDDSE